METLESSRVCRLCGKHSGISIYIFDKNENHVKKINAVLPIMVHEMDLLPKHMCHWCSYKLEEFYKFYADCLKTDTNLKGQLSWMGKEDPQQRVGTPMVHIENIKIEPPDYDAFDMTPMVGDVNYMNSVKSMAFEPGDIPYVPYRCRYCCDKMDQSNRAVSTDYQNTVSRYNGLSNAIHARTDSRSKYATTRKKPLSRVPLRDAKSKMEPLKLKQEVIPPKVERLDDLEGRILRPRKGPINYIESKRKYLKFADKSQRLLNGVELNEHRVRNIASKLKVSSSQVLTAIEDRMNFSMKQEQLSDLNESTLNGSIKALPKNETSNNLAEKLNALPDNVSIKVQDDRVNCDRAPAGFSVDASRAFKSPNKRVPAVPRAPMYLRSQNVSLRNGKKRILDQLNLSPCRLRRNYYNSMDSGKPNGRNLTKAIRRFIDVKTGAASIKPVDNIKHYCDECNTSFVNRELFKLHLCHH